MENATLTMQCPHCGTPNELGSALCANCQSPLTAYAGELRGQEGELEDSRLARQVARLDARPPAVPALAGLLALFALAWPLLRVTNAFRARPALNAENTNYLAASLGSVGPLFTAAVMIPLALFLFWLAFAVWTQRPWAWNAGAVALAVIAVVALVSFAPAFKVLWLVVAGVTGFLWSRPETRAWYGHS